MKVLVFDDSPAHRLAAKLTLKDHEVHIVSSYDEAHKALRSQYDRKRAESIAAELLPKEGFKSDDTSWKLKDDPERAARCDKIWDKANEQATTHPDFDVVLLDLMVPASRQTMGSSGLKFVGQERELGAILALRALHIGIKNVAVVTDMDHHDHPASAAFDNFGRGKCEGINLLCTNRPDFVKMDVATEELVPEEFLKSEAGADKYPSQSSMADKYGQQFGPWEGIETGKDWGDILNRLLPEE